jgi:hypothetical protein
MSSTFATDYVCATSYYVDNEAPIPVTQTDLIQIINKRSVLGFIRFSDGRMFPLTGSIWNFSTIYDPYEGASGYQVYIPIGNLANYYENDGNAPLVFLMPGCGAKVFVNAGYTGTCQLEAYNNTAGIVTVRPNGTNNSSIKMYINVSGNFYSNTGANGYAAVYNIGYNNPNLPPP